MMRIPYWLTLYVPLFYFLLFGGPAHPALLALFLLMAVATHCYLHLLQQKRARMRKNFVAGK